MHGELGALATGNPPSLLPMFLHWRSGQQRRPRPRVAEGSPPALAEEKQSEGDTARSLRSLPDWNPVATLPLAVATQCPDVNTGGSHGTGWRLIKAVRGKVIDVCLRAPRAPRQGCHRDLEVASAH